VAKDSNVIGEDAVGADGVGSGDVETGSAVVVVGGSGGLVVVGGGPDISDTRLIGLRILPGLLQRL
jgi:hypothetical protein